MNAPQANHPKPADLAAFAVGKLSDEAARAVAGHLTACPACRRAAEGAPGDSFVAQVKAAGAPVPSANTSFPGVFQPTAAPLNLPPALTAHPRYRVLRELGRGGMGVVYQARQTVMDRQVVIKVISQALLEQPGAAERFQREVRAAARLSHPNIVAAYDAEQVGDLHLLVMEYVPGHSLAEVLRKRGRLPVPQACHFARQAALGLQHASEQGMVHRDIKPENLMLTPRGQVKILDFGLAKMVSENRVQPSLTALNSYMGTPDYSAPEQATDARSADVRADIYSLGCTLYCLLAGRPPFREDTPVQTILAHIDKEPTPLPGLRPDVPAALWAVVAKMMAKIPARRYQKPAEVAQALAPFCRPGPKPAPAAPTKAASVDPFADLDMPPVGVKPPTGKGPKGRNQPTTGLTGRARDWRALAGGALALLVLAVAAVSLAAVVLRVKTPQGTIEVAVNEPDAELFIDGDKIEVRVPGDNQPLEITRAPGRHTLVVTKGGFQAETKEITLQPGKQEVVRVTLKPAERGLPTAFKNSLGMEFVLVPRGKSWLGGGGGKFGDKEVEITQDFYLGKYEVTQAEWEKVMGTNPSHFSRTGGGKGAVKDIPDDELKRFPVETVSWDDCQKFVSRLNELAKKSGWVYRLPKEVEWEYACRNGPMTDRFESAFDFYFAKPQNRLLPEQAQFGKGPSGRPCRVGSYSPNRLGLYDMHGNVWEWCADKRSQRDGNAAGPRVLRGGGWFVGESGEHRAAWDLAADPPSTRKSVIGLRVALVPSGTSSVNQDGFMPLFLGKDLSGWDVEASTGGTWKVEGEALVGRSSDWKTRTNVLSASEYADFTLRFDFMIEATTNAAVFVRALDGEKLLHRGELDRNHPGIRLMDGEKFKNMPSGSHFWLKDNRNDGQPDPVPRVVLGQWHPMEVTVRGDTCIAFIGNQRVLNLKLDPGVGIDLVPALKRTRGNIGFGVAEGVVRFRNVRIKELPPTKLDGAGFVPLFNGKDTRGWHDSEGSKASWRVDGGTLIGSGEFGYLVTDRNDFENFRLRVEAKVGAGGDSGLCFRVQDPRTARAYEAQIGAGRPGMANTGSFVLFDGRGAPILRPAPQAVPPGQWFTMEVLAEGNRFTICVDGKQTAQYEDREGRYSRGAVSLQQIGPRSEVSFRKVEIKELTAGK